MQSITAPEAPAPAGRNTDARWLSLGVLCTGFLMIIVDATVVNVALPSIQQDLGFSSSGLAWVVNAYLIPFGGLLLLAGRLGDLIGRAEVFLTGVVLFTISSAACGLATGSETLIAARFVQGLAGALTSAVVLGMIVTLFREPAEQGRAMGVYAFVASSGGALGLLLGGLLTDLVSWHWIFFVNVPIGIATLVLGLRLLPRAPGLGLSHGADVPGAALITGALMLGVFAIVQAADHGWLGWRTAGLLPLALAILGLFVLREHTAARPLLPLRLFRSRLMVAANLVQVLMIAGFFAMFFLGALYLQRVLGYDPLGVGLAFLPDTLMMAALSLFLSARLVARFGPKRVLLTGLVLSAAGLAWFARAPIDGDYLVDILPAMIVMGVGAGLAFPPLMTLAMAGAPAEDAGLASGLVNTTAQVGAAIGLAVLATLSAARIDALSGFAAPQPEDLVGGYRLAFVVAACLVLASVAAASVLLRAGDARDAAGDHAPAAHAI